MPIAAGDTLAQKVEGWVFAWCLLGVCLVFAWCLLGVCLVFAWCLLGVCLVFAWCLLGVCLVFAWCLLGVCLVFAWCRRLSCQVRIELLDPCRELWAKARERGGGGMVGSCSAAGIAFMRPTT